MSESTSGRHGSRSSISGHGPAPADRAGQKTAWLRDRIREGDAEAVRLQERGLPDTATTRERLTDGWRAKLARTSRARRTPAKVGRAGR